MKINRYNQFIVEKQQVEYLQRLQKLNESLINEEAGFKDVLMGLALLAGVVGGSVSPAQAQTRLKDKEVANKIELVLNDKQQLQTAIDSLEARGMGDAAEVIQKNADDVKHELKKLGKTYSNVTVKDGDYARIAKLLKKGYAISEITTKNAIQKIEKDTTYSKTIFSVDTVDINWSNDELFGAGLYQISPEFKDSLTSVFQQLKDNDLSIVSINIESSTDKQRIGGVGAKLQADGFEASNKGLSEARNNSVKGVIESIFSESDSETPIINQNILHDQGKGQENASTEQDPSARYIKITIICTHISEDVAETPTVKVVDEKDVVIQSFKLTKAKDVEINVPPVKSKLPKKTKTTHKKFNPSNCRAIFKSFSGRS
jgi:outer membrane protein OmpA-like peptidoglycan-associated protein